MILNGKNKQDYIGELNKIIVLLVLLIMIKDIVMNFWDQKKDYVLHH